MSKVWIVQQKDGKTAMTDFQRADFHDYCKMHPKAVFRLEPSENPVSDEMRGYYYGAVQPMLKVLVPEWAELTSDELHEVLKKEFNFFEAWNSVTKRVERFGRSVMAEDRLNRKAIEFVSRIADWVETNYDQTLPNPEEWKRFRDMPKMR